MKPRALAGLLALALALAWSLGACDRFINLTPPADARHDASSVVDGPFTPDTPPADAGLDALASVDAH